MTQRQLYLLFGEHPNQPPCLDIAPTGGVQVRPSPHFLSHKGGSDTCLPVGLGEKVWRSPGPPALSGLVKGGSCRRGIPGAAGSSGCLCPSSAGPVHSLSLIAVHHLPAFGGSITVGAHSTGQELHPCLQQRKAVLSGSRACPRARPRGPFQDQDPGCFYFKIKVKSLAKHQNRAEHLCQQVFASQRIVSPGGITGGN